MRVAKARCAPGSACCERPDTPGFLTVTASEVPGEDQRAPQGSRILDLAVVSDATDTTEQPTRLIPVFTSLEQFALFTGGKAWFSTTGADALGLLPPGLDVWVDGRRACGTPKDGSSRWARTAAPSSGRSSSSLTLTGSYR
jgi:hypothetical protein